MKKVFFLILAISTWSGVAQSTPLNKTAQGAVLSVHRNGEIDTIQFNSEVRVGKWEEYYCDSVKGVGEYLPYKLQYNDTLIEVFESSEELISYYSNMKYMKDGMWVYYDKKGREIRKEFYSNGKKVYSNSILSLMGCIPEDYDYRDYFTVILYNKDMSGKIVQYKWRGRISVDELRKEDIIGVIHFNDSRQLIKYQN